MTMLCKKCKKAFRKDMSEFDESDEYCPHCDAHYVRRPASLRFLRSSNTNGPSLLKVIEAKMPQQVVAVETEDVRVDSRIIQDDRQRAKLRPTDLDAYADQLG